VQIPSHLFKPYLEETAANPEEIDLSTFQNWATTGETFRKIIEQDKVVIRDVTTDTNVGLHCPTFPLLVQA
jgi:hypothetical protein